MKNQSKMKKSNNYSLKNIIYIYFNIFSLLIIFVVQGSLIYNNRIRIPFQSSLIEEVFIVIQFLGLNIILLYLPGKFIHKILTFLLIFTVNFFYFLLEVFYSETHITLDFYFFKNGLGELSFVLSQYYLELLLICIIALLSTRFFFMLKRYLHFKKSYIYIILLGIITIIIPQFLPRTAKNRIYIFVDSMVVKDQILDDYRSFYDSFVEKSIEEKKEKMIQVKKQPAKDKDDQLDNIIILQLESISSFLVDEKTTPNLLALSKKGTFFPYFYSNSVQTILGQENILCSLPSSFDATLVKMGKDAEVNCLPGIMSGLGYTSFFMKTYNLEFTRTGEFMKNIGFDYVLANELMENGDPRSGWGYREDVFFERAINFLSNNKKEKNFIYLEVGPSNHWPFVNFFDYEGEVPYPNATNHKEMLSNTTFIQDSYLDNFWEKINRLFPDGNFTIILTSDHSWPVGMHEGNTFAEQNGYEENFLIPLLIIRGQHQEVNIVEKQRYSLMDIKPTILDLLGLNYPINGYAESFAGIFKGQELHRKASTILIQPYSRRSLNLIKENIKYQYSFDEKKLLIYDLGEDPDESSPKFQVADKEKNRLYIKELFSRE